MASGGYPGSYAKGKPILGLAEAANAAEHKSFSRRHGVEGRDQIVTNGGRVLGVTALGKDLKARKPPPTPPWKKFISTARIFVATLRRKP